LNIVVLSSWIMLLLHPAVKIVPHLMFIHILALRWTEVLRSSLTTGNWGVLYMLSSIASVADLLTYGLCVRGTEGGAPSSDLE